jgi:hypothetical protein
MESIRKMRTGNGVEITGILLILYKRMDQIGKAIGSTTPFKTSLLMTN